MAAFVKHDKDGNILSFGMMSEDNISIQKTRVGEQIKQVVSVEKGFDLKYKVQMDDKKKAITTVDGKVKLESRQ